MTWNYRVMRHMGGSLAIHEAFYDEDKETPHSWTSDPVPITGEDIDDLLSSLNMMHRALLKPILEYDRTPCAATDEPRVAWWLYHQVEKERSRYRTVLEEIVAWSNSPVCVARAREALEYGDGLRVQPAKDNREETADKVGSK